MADSPDHIERKPPRPSSAGNRGRTVTGGPEIVARSVVIELYPKGGAPGVRLQDLAQEPPLPELAMGPEKYRILELLGEGGMGKVYLAYDQDIGRRVALKMLREATPDQTRRFVEEARVMGQLQHPGIVPLLEIGRTAQGQLYYTMPVVKGRTLSSILDALRAGQDRERRRYSLAALIQVFLQILQAVSYGHAKGVVHRDLKPANVMVGLHGEVQVLDWGLAKVVQAGGVETGLNASLTRDGCLIGTPAFMSPEQVGGRDVDGRADVYALGVMLYELLTLERPFEGDMVTVMAAHVREEPLWPRRRAPNRYIPLELERVSLGCLEKDRGDRPQSVDQVIETVQLWLEAEADSERRHELAEAKAAEGRAKIAEYRRLKTEVSRLEVEAEETAKRFESWQPAEEKAELFEAEDRVKEAERLLVRMSSELVGTLTSALEQEATHAGARELYAEYYWEHFEEAEARSDASTRDFYGELVARHDDGRYATALRGDGSLALSTNPSGAELWLHELVEEGPILMERNERLLGVTPLEETSLAMGSYLILVKKEGYRDVRYPVHITRNREWRGKVKLWMEEEIGEGFIYVPAAPVPVGGDPSLDEAQQLPRGEIEVRDFFIAEHPVTLGEYLEFLNDLARSEGVGAAKGRSPRSKEDDPRTSHLLEDGSGGLRLPEVDAQGDRWDPRLPALSINWQDAVAYCAWRSVRDGREVRLPSEEEWEKAARGVDGRWYPWGWRFDASLCNMRASRKERTTPVVVEEFPRDVSVYGVRGLGGNVYDWTSTEDVEGTAESRRAHRVSRGGSWGGAARSCRAAYRWRFEPANVGDNRGFRLARSPR